MKEAEHEANAQAGKWAVVGSACALLGQELTLHPGVELTRWEKTLSSYEGVWFLSCGW